jgi:putative phosphoserine phosphatase/1-acylglycerol-3-phosphate O-acyltransferase
VSSALRYQIEPFARDLEIADVLCTRLVVEDDLLTGEVVHPTCYGTGKAIAARRLAAERGIDLGESFFYTDSDEDLPLLDIVGRPRPLNPNRSLKAIAAKRGWPARSFASRGMPEGEQLLRTGLAVGSIIPSVLVGLPAALLDRSWRPAMNLAMSIWGDMGTALAGIDLRVTGEEHLWSHRPAVFIFNHQSAVDPMLLCKLLRRDIVGVAKREIRDIPVLGQAFAFTGTVFIDRFDHDKAVKALEPAVESLRKGISLVIAPEGTRSPTPRLGRFKKGAFHLALAARAPIVPIVFRNAHDVLPKNGMVMRPTTVEVVVLPPISTKRWRTADIDTHVSKTEALYRKQLSA